MTEENGLRRGLPPGEKVVVGYRMWMWNQGRDLIGPYTREPIDPFGRNEASCIRPLSSGSGEPQEHQVPYPSCSCGFHAVSLLTALLSRVMELFGAVDEAVVIGRVRLWGGVIEEETGEIRARHMQIVQLHPLEDPSELGPMSSLAGATLGRELERHMSASYGERDGNKGLVYCLGGPLHDRSIRRRYLPEGLERYSVRQDDCFDCKCYEGTLCHHTMHGRYRMRPGILATWAPEATEEDLDS